MYDFGTSLGPGDTNQTILLTDFSIYIFFLNPWQDFGAPHPGGARGQMPPLPLATPLVDSTVY